MLETGLVLGMSATHLGVPLADLVAWGLVLALLAAPVPLDESRRVRLSKAAARNTSDVGGVSPRYNGGERREAIAVAPAATRLSAAEQWQAVSRLVSTGAERAIAVARDHQSIRRELDSLDFSLENIRRELAAVMTLPAVHRAELVSARVPRRSQALAA